MKCNKCGYENQESTKFCENCGNKLQMHVSYEPINQNSFSINNQNTQNDDFKIKNNKKSNLIGGIVLLLLGTLTNFATFFFFGPFLGSTFIIIGVVLILNYILENKKVLKIILSILFSMLIITITSFIAYFIWTKPAEKDKSDIIEEHKDYFSYALGDYTYTYEYYGDDRCGLMDCIQYKDYTINFYDKLGTKQKINIHSEGDFEEHLGYAIEKYLNNRFDELYERKYEKKINKIIEKRELYKFIDEEIITSNDGMQYIPTYTYIQISKIDDTTNYSDSKNGVNIQDIDFKNLKENNINVNLTTSIYFNCDIDDIKDLKEYLIDSYGKYLDLFEHDNVKFSFNIRFNNNSSYKWVKYILKLDSLNNFYWEDEEK